MTHKQFEEFILSLPGVWLDYPFGEDVAVYKSTKSKKMREWLVKTAGDLENIQKQINQIIKAD